MLGGNRVIGWIYTNLKHEEWVWCREPGIWEVGLMMMMCDTWRPDCCTTDSTAAIRHTVNIVKLHPVIAFGLQWLCLTTLWGEWSVYLPYIKQIDGLFSGSDCWSVWSPGSVQGQSRDSPGTYRTLLWPQVWTWSTGCNSDLTRWLLGLAPALPMKDFVYYIAVSSLTTGESCDVVISRAIL